MGGGATWSAAKGGVVVTCSATFLLSVDAGPHFDELFAKPHMIRELLGPGNIFHTNTALQASDHNHHRAPPREAMLRFFSELADMDDRIPPDSRSQPRVLKRPPSHRVSGGGTE